MEELIALRKYPLPHHVFILPGRIYLNNLPTPGPAAQLTASLGSSLVSSLYLYLTMKPTFTIQHVRCSHLIFCILAIPSILVIAQEACVKSCTKVSGINECIGAIPHTAADWDVLGTDVKNCYCIAAVNFAGCSPKCDISGFDPDTQGRVFGSWRYVNQVCADVVKTKVASGNDTATTTTLSFSTIPAQLLNTGVPTVALSAVPTPESSEPAAGTPSHSSPKGRTIAISVSLANLAVLAIGAGVWFWFRRRRQNQIEQSEEGQQSVVIGPDGFPVDQSGPNLVSPMRAEFRTDNIKEWIEEQERMKQQGVDMEPDAQTETLSVGYTLWSETDLCFTEMGADDARDRDMEPIAEEPIPEEPIPPGGEDEILSTYRVV